MLKRSGERRPAPVLVFPSSQADEDVRAAYNGHANGYISKPSELKSLCAVIESIEGRAPESFPKGAD